MDFIFQLIPVRNSSPRSNSLAELIVFLAHGITGLLRLEKPSQTIQPFPSTANPISNHVPKCHIHRAFQSLQERGFHHCGRAGQAFPWRNFPYLQSKPPPLCSGQDMEHGKEQLDLPLRAWLGCSHLQSKGDPCPI